MKETIKDYLFPKVDPEVQEHMDAETLNSIYRLSFVVIIFECFTMVLFLLTRKEFNRATWISIGSVSFCILSCVFGVVCAGLMMKKEDLSHIQVLGFKFFYSIVLEVWAIFVSYRNYAAKDQFFTFFAVELLLVCFIPLSPIINVCLTLFVYVSLFAVMFSIDGATGVNTMNYMVLMLVSIAGMLVRYHSQLNMSEKTVQLTRSNELLEFNNRHDALTGLLNRQAFREDIGKALGTTLKVFMIDINYFKEINDTFGHTIGDDVLKETANRIRTLFPDSNCYRYGGDEFLVMNSGGEVYMKDTYVFNMPQVTDREILLSIGYFEATPQSNDELNELIASADAVLYKVKKRTHSKEFGGHDRRQSRGE